MSPADDYIASFVREVNRARVINVETVATTLDRVGREPKFALPVGTKLEEAARAMTGIGADEVAVVAQDGEIVGVLTLLQTVDAMVNAQAAY